ncbi:MAG: NADH-quinone oxidoreductase subunit H [Bdellovibrionales bacterium]|nr:NADH-quinone oxidoreductase subunit H [Bdellovibrionales bacterium]
MNHLVLAVEAWMKALESYTMSLSEDSIWLPFFGILNQVPQEVWLAVSMFLSASMILGMIIAPIAGFSTFVERRVAGRIQARIGCNRVGPEGLLQFLVDGVKLMSKEDHIPQGADRFLFKLAPYFLILGAFMSFACLPFGKYIVVSNINVGILYLLAVSSLVVIGILLAGWSSNNKWSLLGAMRSAAQIVSYEVPLGMSLMIPVMLVGSLSLAHLNRYQAEGFSSWLIFAAGPFTFIAFFVYFISALAEVNRTPFDLPEAESELVSGYNTEYSGIRWGLFFVAEYANMFLIGGIATTAFLGGWQKSVANIPFLVFSLFFIFFALLKIVFYGPAFVQSLGRKKGVLFALAHTKVRSFSKPLVLVLLFLSVLSSVGLHVLSDFWLVSFFVFISKSYFFVFIIMWIRWTLPRYRVDQMMDLCWKRFTPLMFVCVMGTALWMLWSQR